MSTQSIPAMPWMMTPQTMQEHWEQFARRLAQMPRVAQIAQSVRTGSTPYEVVTRMDQIRLLRYESTAQQRFATPLLLVFALVNRPYILDLRPTKSVVRQFLNAGFDVYQIDWGEPTDGDRFLGMEDYIEGYMHSMIKEVAAQTQQDQINLLGYCMGGSMSAMYTALHQDLIRNLILMAAPVDWSTKESLLAVWTDEKYFDVDKVIDVFGNAPAQWLQGSFLMLKPVDNLIAKYFTFFDNLENEKFLEDFFAMEAWLNDNIPVAGQMFREFVKYCFQQNRLIEGRLKVGGRTVDLGTITCPLLNLTATNDHLVPCGQSLPLNDVVGSKDRRSINFRAGHIGLAVGSRAHRELWPEVCDWLGTRSDRL